MLIAERSGLFDALFASTADPRSIRTSNRPSILRVGTNPPRTDVSVPASDGANTLSPAAQLACCRSRHCHHRQSRHGAAHGRRATTQRTPAGTARRSTLATGCARRGAGVVLSQTYPYASARSRTCAHASNCT